MKVDCVVDSPIGHWRVEETEGAVSAVHVTKEALRSPATPLLAETARQLQEYFAGSRTAFTVRVRCEGTPFRQQCWQVLCGIPYGQTISYGEQARRVGKPGAARAVGGANHHNPVCIIVPCHRVIGADGSLTGYGEGLDVKVWLLAHEKRVLAATGPKEEEG